MNNRKGETEWRTGGASVKKMEEQKRRVGRRRTEKEGWSGELEKRV